MKLLGFPFKIICTTLLTVSMCNADNFISEVLPSNFGTVGAMNTKRMEGYRLNVPATLSTEVSYEHECFQLCLKNPTKCLTFNVVVNGGTKICELLDFDALEKRGSLEEDGDSVYFGLQTKCWDYPCKNYGKCVPDYNTDQFTCDCTLCYEGTNCEIVNEEADPLCADFGNYKLIQRRTAGSSVDFARNWEEYKNGFGDPSGDYWLGNEAIHSLTQNTCKLKFTLRFQGNEYIAIYDSFSVGDESSFYTLSVSDYQGNIEVKQGDNPDQFSRHHGSKFSTYDHDHDSYNGNCADNWIAGWWFTSCFEVYLNKNKMYWLKLTTSSSKIDYADMKVLC